MVVGLKFPIPRTLIRTIVSDGGDGSGDGAGTGEATRKGIPMSLPDDRRYQVIQESTENVGSPIPEDMNAFSDLSVSHQEYEKFISDWFKNHHRFMFDCLRSQMVLCDNLDHQDDPSRDDSKKCDSGVSCVLMVSGGSSTV